MQHSFFVFSSFFISTLLVQSQTTTCEDYRSEILQLQDQIELLEISLVETDAKCQSIHDIMEIVDSCTCESDVTSPEVQAQISAWENAVSNGGLECTFVPDEYRNLVCPSPSLSPSLQPTMICQDTLPTTDCEQARDLGLCDALTPLSSCALTCGSCCEIIQFSNCLDEYVAHCVSSGVDNALNCLSQLPTSDVSFCCQEYIRSEIPNMCGHLVVENSLYDGTYSIVGTRNGQHMWANGDVDIYFSENLDIGARWLFVSDMSNYYLVLSDLLRPPGSQSWVHSSSAAAEISMTCTSLSASPTRTPSFPPSLQPVPEPSDAPFGLSDYGDVPSCCRLAASTPRGTANLVQDSRLKNGQVYWRSADGGAEIYWSEGLWGNRWIFSGLQQFGYWGFTPLYLDFMGTTHWEYHDYSLGFDNIIPMEETVTITCTSEPCDDSYEELCDLCATTCSN